jgi:hypothetical protein
VVDDKQVEYNEAEAMLLGINPDVKDVAQKEEDKLPPDPKDWTDADKARVAEIMNRLHYREEPEPETNLKEHFTKGETLVDPNGLRTRISSVGKGAMTVNLIGTKNRFVDGFQITIRGFIFITARSRGTKTCLQLCGVASKTEVPNGETKAK